MEILRNNILLLALTFSIYYLAQKIQKRTRWIWFNPILMTIASLIIYLKVCNIPYETYKQAGVPIDFWLRPAIVALGVPLYVQFKNIKKQFVPILISQLVGCLVGIVSAVFVAKAFGASHEVIISLAPKSVTTPIAMEICSSIGGIPSLTAAIVITTGLIGAVMGFQFLHFGRVYNPISKCLGMGTACHVIGTACSLEISPTHGAFSSVGLIINGILTAIFTPIILSFLCI